MNFGEAIEAMKLGSRVTRKGWNGKGMFIYLVRGTKIRNEDLRNEAAEALERDSEFNRGKDVVIGAHIDMHAADGSIVVGWLASQTDMLAEDWKIAL